MPNRITKLADKLAEHGFDAYIAARPPNIRYYAGSIGGSFLVVVPDSDPLLLVSVLDENVTRDQARDCHVETYTPVGLLNKFADILRRSHGASVGFDDLPLATLNRVGKRLPEIAFKQDQEVVWAQRSVKDAGELKLMREAGRLADAAMEALWEKLGVGVTENQLAAEASYAMMKEGAEAHAFEFTVGSGPRSAYPHASSTGRKIEKGDLIVVDIGASYNGYCSDITRTFIAGKPDSKRRELYETVLSSHDATYTAMKPEIGCKEVDTVSRKIIEDAGYGPNYTHSLGHGVGLEIHEPPSVSQRSNEKLVPGNVVSDEPGIYIHGFGGVRIEDTVKITGSGAKRLTNFPRDIEKATF
ncbi:MAG: Xaa-Pro peptidase family protein [Candidatus Bathyarchaeota archaeon]|nr:Xaa-Pro peptidase family protein [Candidatus Bathyarchaeota archaeon]